MRFLLDTNIFIAAFKRNPAVLARMETLRPADLVLSPIVLGELEVGISKSQWPRENRQRLDAVISAIRLEPLTGEVSRAYGRIRSALEREGRVIGAMTSGSRPRRRRWRSPWLRTICGNASGSMDSPWRTGWVPKGR